MFNKAVFNEAQIPSLNGWRAIAIILVMLDHAKYTQGFPWGHLTAWSQLVFMQGNLGVRIFFVLSGFLITHLLLNEAERSAAISAKNFYLRRSLRILPVYVIYLGVLEILVSARVYSGEQTASWVGALTFTRNMLGPASSYTGHFWSLAVEEQFYLIWPLCLIGLALWKRPQDAMKFLLIPILLCPLIRMGGFTAETNGEICGRIFGGNSILMYADSLAIGCLGAFLIRRWNLRLTATTSSLVFVLGFFILIYGVCWINIGGETGYVIPALIPTFQALAILAAMLTSTQESNFAYSFLNWKPMNVLGMLSYSLYIWHVLFLCSYTGSSFRALLYNWHYWWIGALAVAAISYYCVERPILRLKERFKTRSQPREICRGKSLSTG